jgi:hypothetical protein
VGQMWLAGRTVLNFFQIEIITAEVTFITFTKTVAFRLGAGSGGSGRFTPGVPEDPLDDRVVLKSAARPA